MSKTEDLQDLLRAYQLHVDGSTDPNRYDYREIRKSIDLESRDLLDLVLEAVTCFAGGDERQPATSYGRYVASELVDNNEAGDGEYPNVTDSTLDSDGDLYYEVQTQHEFELSDLTDHEHILWSHETFSLLEDWCIELEREEQRNTGDPD